MIPLGKTLATRERVELAHKLSTQTEAFGDKIVFSESAKTVMFGCPVNRQSELLVEVKENLYKSRQTEVLGKGLDRHYRFPKEVADPQFAFGVPIAKS